METETEKKSFFFADVTGKKLIRDNLINKHFCSVNIGTILSLVSTKNANKMN